jgi:hypothetical protein
VTSLHQLEGKVSKLQLELLWIRWRALVNSRITGCTFAELQMSSYGRNALEIIRNFTTRAICNNSLNLKYWHSFMSEFLSSFKPHWLSRFWKCLCSLIYHTMLQPTRSFCLYNTQLLKTLLICFRIRNSYRKHEMSEQPGRTLCKDVGIINTHLERQGNNTRDPQLWLY